MIKVARSGEGVVRVTFVLPADTPPTSVVGDFNDWDPHAAPMRKRSNGTRSAAVEVPEGTRLQFRYLIDGGEWALEPDAERVPGQYGEDSVITV